MLSFFNLSIWISVLGEQLLYWTMIKCLFFFLAYPIRGYDLHVSLIIGLFGYLHVKQSSYPLARNLMTTQRRFANYFLFLSRDDGFQNVEVF